MPESVIGEVVKVVAETVFEVVTKFAGYYTAVILVPPLSMGTMYVEPLSETSSRQRLWHGCYRDERGKIVVGHHAACLLGMMFWVLMALLVAYFVF
ncbi:MAG: hypothetical protein ACRDD3_09375 [Azovibrio sp.]